MNIQKPSWLQTGLSWLNFNRGEWVDWWIVVVPPFSFTPGDWIEYAVDWLLDFVNFVYQLAQLAHGLATGNEEKIDRALGEIADIAGGMGAAIAGAVDAVFGPLWDLAVALVDTATRAWSAALDIARGEIEEGVLGLFQSLAGPLNDLWDWRDDIAPKVASVLDLWYMFGSTMVAFFQHPFDWLEGHLEEWLFGPEE